MVVTLSKNLFRLFILDLLSCVQPLLLLDPYHCRSEPVNLLLHLLAAESPAPVCREHHLHCLSVNLDVVLQLTEGFFLFILSR